MQRVAHLRRLQLAAPQPVGGLYGYGIYTYRLYSYGLDSYGLYRYGLYSYGLHMAKEGDQEPDALVHARTNVYRDGSARVTTHV